MSRILPDGNTFYFPDTGFNAGSSIDNVINEIYDSQNPHHYETYYKLNSGMTVVDAGANAGLFTLKASKLVGPDGLVIALEPFPYTFKVLAYNVKRNNCKNVILVNKGLWSRECKKKLIVRSAYAVNSVLTTSSPNDGVLESTIDLLNKIKMQYSLLTHKIGLVEVDLTTLDGLMDSLGIKQIDFLKMDIEGSEDEALKGYTKITKENILSLETHQNLNAILYAIQQKGYPPNNTHIVPLNEIFSIIHTRF